VVVASADAHSYHDRERGNVTDLRPMLWVSTDPEFGEDLMREASWTIRGRAYYVHYRLFYQDRSHLPGGGRWHPDGYQPLRGKFRNDRGGLVDFQSKTWGLMWDAMVGAADTFTAGHSGWDGLSCHLYHRDNAEREDAAAANALQEAWEHEQRAIRHRERQIAAGSEVPWTVMDLVRD
ncbi:hypothetical protein, partial [Staphylococcus pasteuri]|uniref:hypothetical protein n=1 Tax=Staphylococcus pasteuri TaxID=45972 RepID=UPI0036F4C13B